VSILRKALEEQRGTDRRPLSDREVRELRIRVSLPAGNDGELDSAYWKARWRLERRRAARRSA
jgi:hypothetical protein